MSKIAVPLLILIFLLIGCKNNVISEKSSKDKTTLVVELKKQPENSPFGISLTPMRVARSSKPSIKGVPEMDTFLLVYATLVNSRSVNELYKKGLIDSIAKPKDSFHSRNYAITGYRNGKQVLIFDTNNDLDFSDEKMIAFNKDLSKTVDGNVRQVKPSFPLWGIDHDFYDGTKLTKQKQFIRPMPYTNFSIGLKDKLENELQLIMESSSYNTGKTLIGDADYQVLVSDGGFFGPSVLILEEGAEVPKSHAADFLDYSIKDTILIGEKYYRLDSINPAYTELVIKDLKMNDKDYGYRKGGKLNNFQISGLNGHTPYPLAQLLKDKDYLLIDFWGTWCAPCKELTPKLQELNKKYGDQVNLLSVAFDKEIEPVIDYVNEHGMQWNHHFIEGDAKSRENRPPLIQGLKVETFPTFILIDHNFRILYRGVGKTGLEQAASKLEGLLNSKAN